MFFSRGRGACGEQAVAVDEVVLEGRGHVGQHQRGHREGEDLVQGLDGFGEFPLGATKSGSGNTPNTTTGKPAAEL